MNISHYQHVVTTFVECQQQALDRIAELEMDKQQTLSRVTHLEEEIASHKAHIATLKNELAAACRRPISDEGLSDDGQYVPGVVKSFISLLTTQIRTIFSTSHWRNDYMYISFDSEHAHLEKFDM